MSDGTHPSDPAKTPLAVRITEVYWRRVRDTGLREQQAKTLRDELSVRVTECLQHFKDTAPDVVAELERAIERYDRLRDAVGVDRRLLEEPSRLLPGVLGHIQAVAEALLGALPALFGLVTGGIPYLVTKKYGADTRATGPGESEPRRTSRLVGALSFSLFYGGLIGLVAWQFSDLATIMLAVLLIPTGLFATAYLRRMRTVLAHLGDRTASWFKLQHVARLREAQDDVVGRLDLLRNRYRVEVLGWDPLPRHFKRRNMWSAVARVSAIGVLTASVALFGMAYRDSAVPGLPLGPSPWQETRISDPTTAEREVLRDAQGVLLAARQLDAMEDRMEVLRGEFLGVERDFLTQEDHDELRILQASYLDLRTMLLKTVWLYRDTNLEASAASNDPLEARAFLTGYAAAALLTEKAWLLYDTFKDDPITRQQLDAGDLAWGIPEGTFRNIESSLSNESILDSLEMATRRFESDRGEDRLPRGAPWTALAARAEHAGPALEEVFEGIVTRKLIRAFQVLSRQARAPVEEITPVVSMTISRVRFKERPPHQGLISPQQLEALRAELQPGDILIERRNWYISNSLLPGFWPHAALYLGSYEELVALGVAADARAEPHMADFQGQDEMGDDFAVLEAIGEGVIFTSFEQSVGEADAVVVLRPNLSEEDLREALARALSHRGKEYDFDFDFETTDRLVCTELIFRAYDGLLEIPPMRLIMGRPRISATDYVRMWADTRAAGNAQLDLVHFLDFDEANLVAVEGDAETLTETIGRSRFTFAN